MSKLALGTVQFGLNYGINNQSGVINDISLFDLLDYAYNNGIDALDTAYNYGESEKRIGEYLSNTNNSFQIISKAPMGTNSDSIKNHLQKSLEKLNLKSLYGFLLHDFDDYLNDKKLIDELNGIRQSGLINKIGFSIYYPEQLETIIQDNCVFDLIQLPYNLADRRFEKYFELLKKRSVEIHIRSVFLQGLFFMNIDELPEKLKSFSIFINKLNEISKESKRTIENIALNFVSQNKYIDKVVIGVDNKDQLKSNFNESKNNIEHELLIKLEAALSKIYMPAELLIPSNWN